MTERNPSVRFAGVVKRYGRVAVLKGIDLTIEAGQFVALVGGSGSGKSTLIRTINRLVEPDEGMVEVSWPGEGKAGPRLGGRGDDTDFASKLSAAPDLVRGPASSLAATELRRAIGYVIQAIGLFPHMTAGENIALGPRLAGRTIDPSEWLKLVDLPEDFAGRLPATLSGGQQQRVGVARALATGAKLMLMDEPFGALDPVTRDALGQRVRKLHDDLGLTTIMVTHDMAEALLLADRVIVLDKGQVVADATPQQLLAGEGGEAAQALVAVPKRQAGALAEKKAGPRIKSGATGGGLKETPSPRPPSRSPALSPDDSQ